MYSSEIVDTFQPQFQNIFLTFQENAIVKEMGGLKGGVIGRRLHQTCRISFYKIGYETKWNEMNGEDAGS